MPSIINRAGFIGDFAGETGGDERPVDADGNPIETKAAVAAPVRPAKPAKPKKAAKP